MRHSQYLEPYLDGNDRRISEGRLPITIGTFLSQTLTGRAKSYGVKYGQALKRSCIAAGAFEVSSSGGGRAYVRINAEKQTAAIEELAKEFFNCHTASFYLGGKSASLWISDPQRGHYLGAHDAARFHNWATDIIRVRSLNINLDLLSRLASAWTNIQ